MPLSLLALLGGLVLLTVGADRLVEGAVALARRARLSEAVIGATIVAGGTSLPELVASLAGALADQYGLAAGNVVGSNICNIGAILGPVAIIAPLAVGPEIVRRDWWAMIGVSILVVAMAWLSTVGGGADSAALPRWFCLLMLALFTAYVWWSVRSGGATPAEGGDQGPVASWWRSLLWIALGAALLASGGDLLVWGAVRLARDAGISDTIIGLTIVACGTSAPELMTSLIAARRGRAQLAVANVVGSNTFNILFILGVTGSVTELPIARELLQRDLWVMLAFALVLPLAWGRARRIGRTAGGLLLAGYVAYVGVLVASVLRQAPA